MIESKFDELAFFARVKKMPGYFLGKPSLLSLRDQLFGMDYAFSFYNQETPLKYFRLFVEWYHKEMFEDLDGYNCWWNHLLYISGNNDARAFDFFFNTFEQYLQDIHNVCFPEVP